MLRILFIVLSFISIQGFGQNWILEDSIEINTDHLQSSDSLFQGTFAKTVKVEGDLCFISNEISHYFAAAQRLQYCVEYQIFQFNHQTSKWEYLQSIIPFPYGDPNTISIEHYGDFIFFSDPKAYIINAAQNYFISGVVAIYKKSSTGIYEPYQTIHNPLRNKHTAFGSDLIRIDQHLLIGSAKSPFNEFDKNDKSTPGAVFIYSIDSDTFKFDSTLRDQTPENYESFGSSIEEHNNLIAIAADIESYTDEDTLISHAGAVKLYRYEEGNFNYEGVRFNPNPEQQKRFGFDLNLGPQGLMISSAYFDSLVHFYPWYGDSLAAVPETIYPFSSLNQRNRFDQNNFGFVLGVHHAINNITSPHAKIGEVSFYMHALDQWQKVQTIESQIIASNLTDKLDFMGFGRAASLNDDYLMISYAPSDPNVATPPSIVYVYKSYPCNDSFDNKKVNACMAYSSPSGKVYTQSAKFNDTSALPGGCILYSDIELTMNYSTYASIDSTVCGVYKSPSGVAYDYDDISFFDTINNAKGCDSIIYIQLRFNTPNPDVLKPGDGSLYSVAQGTTFQWVDCFDNFRPLKGETNRTFTPWYDGLYAVIIDNTLCTITSECIAMSKDEVMKTYPVDSIQYFPNPNFGTMYINLGIPRESINVEVYNSQGQLIAVERFKNERVLDFALPEESGMYILHLKVDDVDVQVVRIIKI